MPPEEVLREVGAWIRKAESDLRNMELVLPAQDAPQDAVCFHAQQAAEKYIKALLTFHGMPFGETHDLPELVLLLPAGSPVPSAVGDLSDLADAAVGVRHPGPPTEWDYATAEQLVDQAKNVKSAVVPALALQGYAAPR